VPAISHLRNNVLASCRSWESLTSSRYWQFSHVVMQSNGSRPLMSDESAMFLSFLHEEDICGNVRICKPSITLCLCLVSIRVALQRYALVAIDNEPTDNSRQIGGKLLLGVLSWRPMRSAQRDAAARTVIVIVGIIHSGIEWLTGLIDEVKGVRLAATASANRSARIVCEGCLAQVW